uniref:F-box domain-containing protein n=2 Tax=Parascaris univalens TaxID=6257 RepID=A0A915BNS3_PARUN
FRQAIIAACTLAEPGKRPVHNSCDEAQAPLKNQRISLTMNSYLRERYKFVEWYPHRLGQSSLNGCFEPSFHYGTFDSASYGNEEDHRISNLCEDAGIITIDSLPDLVLLKIFCYLHPVERIHKISLVCKRWNELVHSPRIWSEVGKCLRKLCVSCRLTRGTLAFSHIFTSEFNRLTTLDIGNIPVMSVDSMQCMVNNLSNLERLNMECVRMEEPKVFRVLFSKNAFPQLKQLMMGHCAFTEESFQLLVDWERPLEVLSIDGVKPFDITKEIDLGNAYFVGSLRRLYAHGFLVMTPSREEVFKFASVSNFRNLTLFSISFCPCADDRQYLAIKSLSHLEHLHLTGHCSWASTAVLMALFSQSVGGFPSKLKFLCISHFYSLTDDVINEITLNCPMLESLNVSRCDPITDEGFKMIIERLGELRMLDVSVNPSFTNKSLQAITSLNLPHIIYLVVDKCKNVCWEELLQLSLNMKHLWISFALDKLLKAGFCLDDVFDQRTKQSLNAALNELSNIDGYCCVTDITKPFL